MIPKILYKTGPWEESELPKEISQLFKKTLVDNPEYEIKYFSDTQCREFIKNNFKEDVLTTFDTLKPGAYKADLFRYCILYKNGGVYGDLTHEYLVPLSQLIDNVKDNLVLAHDRYRTECKRSGIQISFMAAIPKIALYEIVIETLIANVKNKFYGESPLQPTGPILFGDVLNSIRHIPDYYLGYTVPLFQDGDYYLSDIKTRKKLIKTKTPELKNILYPIEKEQHYDWLWHKKQIYNFTEREDDGDWAVWDKEKIKISYAILACTEVIELKKLLPFLKENKRDEDEIVILLDDSYDTTGVEEVAFKYADEVGYRSLNNDFASQKNALIEMCSGNYIFNIDADELPHKNLMKNLHGLIEQNSNVDVFYVPTVNTVKGLTDEHLHKWGWRINDKGWVNWPDTHMRIHKNVVNIRWKNAVHEILKGHQTFVNLPHQEEWSLYHHKSIKKQEKQNAFYDTLSKTKNLVFTSAGGNTNFDELWLEENRNYDVWVIFYGDDENKFQQYKEKVEFIEKRKGDKWQNFYYVYNTYKEQLKQYTHFFILDDDIIISTDDIKKMFSIAKESTLWICQPSFGKNGRLGHLINKHNKNYYLRYTNFVENNTPLMTRKSIDNFFKYYKPDELSMFGVDFVYIWANGIEEKNRYAIIDSIQCINPVDRIINGEKVRDCLNLNSIEKQVEKWHLFNKKNNIPYWTPKTHQYIPWTKMQIELTKADFSTVVDVKFNEKLSIPSSTDDKIALLFLTRNNLKHPKLWYDFIDDAKGKCNIYAHTKEKDLIIQDFLKEAQIPTHVDTQWGDYSLVKAVNELIRVAVKDPTNKFFVVLCESAIPLHKFGPTYQFLFKNQKSIIYTKITPPDKNELKQICKLMGNPASLNLNSNNIIRNSQWMIITKEHAEIIATTNHEEEFKNFPIADEWYHYNVLQYYDRDFSSKVLNFKPIYFQYDLTDIKDPLPHPIEVTDKELIMDVKKNYHSLFFRKVSPTVTVEYQEL